MDEIENVEEKRVPPRGCAGAKCLLLRYYSRDIGIALLRIGTAGMVLAHGIPKLVILARGDGGTWLDPLGMGGTVSLSLCVFAEFVCAVAVLIGIFTRIGALVLAINFWVVVFVYDAGTQAQAELPQLYLLCFTTLVCTGGGFWSLDHLAFRNK